MGWRTLVVAGLLGLVPIGRPCARGEDSIAQELAEATSELTDGQTYLLRYGYQPGERLQYRVDHDARVDTTIRGTTQKTRSHSESIKVWEILPGESDDQIRLTHRVEAAQMWSEVTGRQRVEYDSRSGEPPPAEYASVAKTLGKPLATITMDRRGRVLERHDEIQRIDLGFGAVAIPLPEQAVPVGFAWSSPFELRIRMDNGQYKTIKIQQRYELEQVKTGVATISIRTQILTPIRDPKIESQLIQRMSAGKLRFDLVSGRVLSKELDWDESIVAFNGPDSHMHYAAKFAERLLEGEEEVAQRGVAAEAPSER